MNQLTLDKARAIEVPPRFKAYWEMLGTCPMSLQRSTAEAFARSVGFDATIVKGNLVFSRQGYPRLVMHMPHGHQFTSGRVKIFIRFFKQFII
jgi:hypothetical protein